MLNLDFLGLADLRQFRCAQPRGPVRPRYVRDRCRLHRRDAGGDSHGSSCSDSRRPCFWSRAAMRGERSWCCRTSPWSSVWRCGSQARLRKGRHSAGRAVAVGGVLGARMSARLRIVDTALQLSERVSSPATTPAATPAVTPAATPVATAVATPAAASPTSGSSASPDDSGTDRKAINLESLSTGRESLLRGLPHGHEDEPDLRQRVRVVWRSRSARSANASSVTATGQRTCNT